LQENIDRIHQIYMYPARFKPEIPRQVLKMINTYNHLPVLDPFAGSGTLAIEAYLQEINSISYDLNPIIEILVDAKIKILEKSCNPKNIEDHIKKAGEWSKKRDIDEKVQEWYPQEAIDYLATTWSYMEENVITFDHKSKKFEFIDGKCGSLTSIIMLYATRKISYTDNSIYKYYRSKMKKQWLDSMKEKHGSIINIFKHYAHWKLNQITRLLKHLPEKRKKESIVYVRGYVDLLIEKDLPKGNIAGIITSPPYLKAHEYIRSFKYDLYWLGLTLEEIRDLSRREIPYRPTPPTKINSTTYMDYKKRVIEKGINLLRAYENYFNAIISIFDRITDKLIPNGIFAYFVGNPMLGGIEIPINKILMEHYVSKGYTTIDMRKDPIRKRRLFKGRNNANPQGIPSEYLVILRKNE